MTSFRPLLGTYSADIVVAPFTVLINTSSAANTAWTQPTWSSTFPLGTSGATGSLGVSGITRIATGSYQVNARDAFPRYLAVNLSLAPSGSTTAPATAGLFVEERYDLRSSASGSSGGNGTFVFEISSGSLNEAQRTLVDPSVPVAVNVIVFAATHSVTSPGSQPGSGNNVP
jgi:hypothetical protein